MTKRLVNRIDEKQYIIPLSRRQPFFYIDKCIIVKSNDSVKVLKKIDDSNIEHDLPVANIGSIILGPGCSITSEAIRVISSRGCHVIFTGQGGIPIYSKTIHHRSSTNKLKQFNMCQDEEKNFKAGLLLLNERNTIVTKYCSYLPLITTNSANKSNLLGLEASWAKRSYAIVSNRNSIPLFIKKDSQNHPINLMNHLLYSLTDVTISFMGLDPDIGILHGRTKGGGLCYDIADVYKPLLTLDQSMIAQKEMWSAKRIKDHLLEEILEYDIIDMQINLLKRIFEL